MNTKYDDRYDILYVAFKDRSKSYCKYMEFDWMKVEVYVDMDIEEVTGLAISGIKWNNRVPQKFVDWLVNKVAYLDWAELCMFDLPYYLSLTTLDIYKEKGHP